MTEWSRIAWTDHTFNPWWGCARVSPACQHCYAEAFAKRTGHDVWGTAGTRRIFGDKHWDEPTRWNAAASMAGQRRKVFCASMADVFEDQAGLSPQRLRLWNLIEHTPNLDWQLLTKRPENITKMVPAEWLDEWPANVWLGVTAEDQQRADERIPTLLAVPGGVPVRFLSCEPLLSQVNLRPWLDPDPAGHSQIDWIIVGGESGPKHRPLDLEHACDICRQAAAGGVAFFFKQVGGHTPAAGGDLLDGLTYHQFPEPVSS